MHDNHLHSLLPQVRQADGSIAEFLLRCGDAKGRMTRDVLEQLQGIAAQQSRIRDMKHKLAVFNEVLTRQAAAFNELQAATRCAFIFLVLFLLLQKSCFGALLLAECSSTSAALKMYACINSHHALFLARNCIRACCCTRCCSAHFAGCLLPTVAALPFMCG
jgi:hypothetical protein